MARSDSQLQSANLWPNQWAHLWHTCDVSPPNSELVTWREKEVFITMSEALFKMLLLFRFSLIKQPTTSIHTECFHPPLLHSHFDSFREREANINPSTQAPHSAPLLTGQGTPGKSLLQSVPSLAVGIQPTFTGHHTLSTKQAHNTSFDRNTGQIR